MDVWALWSAVYQGNPNQDKLAYARLYHRNTQEPQ